MEKNETKITTELNLITENINTYFSKSQQTKKKTSSPKINQYRERRNEKQKQNKMDDIL